MRREKISADSRGLTLLLSFIGDIYSLVAIQVWRVRLCNWCPTPVHSSIPINNQQSLGVVCSQL